MTEQEMLARIQELEEENAELKKEKEKHIKVSLFECFGQTYKWLTISDQCLQNLSSIIRWVCFPRVSQVRQYKLRPIKSWYPVQTKDMTDEQKARYIEIAGKILAVLDEYEVVSEQKRTRLEED